MIRLGRNRSVSTSTGFFFSIFSRERGKNMIVKIHPISLWAEKRKILGPLFFYFSLEI